MRFLLFLLMFSIPLLSWSGDKRVLSQCYENAYTQKELNQCSGIDYKTADAELNRVYKLIRKIYKDDARFLKKMKVAQRNWIKFRDAQFEMMFPDKNKTSFYGSVFPMCAGIYKARLTLERVVQLKQWLKGVEEGDVCAGSLKRPYDIQTLLKQE